MFKMGTENITQEKKIPLGVKVVGYFLLASFVISFLARIIPFYYIDFNAVSEFLYPSINFIGGELHPILGNLWTLPFYIFPIISLILGIYLLKVKNWARISFVIVSITYLALTLFSNSYLPLFFFPNRLPFILYLFDKIYVLAAYTIMSCYLLFSKKVREAFSK